MAVLHDKGAKQTDLSAALFGNNFMPVFIAAVFISIGTTAFNEFVVPKANNAYYQIINYEIKHNAAPQTQSHVIIKNVKGNDISSLMASHVTGLSFSVFVVLLNIPFFIFGYKKIGKSFTASSLFSVCCLAVWSKFVQHTPLTYDPFLSTVFGGIIIGIGVGLIIRWGGSLDGTEIVAIIADKKSPFSVGEIIMAVRRQRQSKMRSALLVSWSKRM